MVNKFTFKAWLFLKTNRIIATYLLIGYTSFVNLLTLPTIISCLSVKEYGMMVLLNQMSAIVSGIVTFALPSIINVNSGLPFTDQKSVLLNMFIFVGLVSIILVFPTSYLLHLFFNRDVSAEVIRIFILNGVISVLNQSILICFRNIDENFKIIGLVFTYTVCAACGVVVFIPESHDKVVTVGVVFLTANLSTFIISQKTCFSYHDYRKCLRFSKFNDFLVNIKYGAWVMLASILVIINSFAVRFFVFKKISAEAVGYLGYVSTIVSIIDMIVFTALSQLWARQRIESSSVLLFFKLLDKYFYRHTMVITLIAACLSGLGFLPLNIREIRGFGFVNDWLPFLLSSCYIKSIVSLFDDGIYTNKRGDCMLKSATVGLLITLIGCCGVYFFDLRDVKYYLAVDLIGSTGFILTIRHYSIRLGGRVMAGSKTLFLISTCLTPLCRLWTS